MGSKTKIALLIPGLLAMLIFISPKVAMAARNFEEGKFVEETNEAGDSRLVNDVKIPDIGNSGFGGITDAVGIFPRTLRSILQVTAVVMPAVGGVRDILPDGVIPGVIIGQRG